ncbi:MAG: HNH endonuclease [Geodermatophilaceae bacterium]|nr:HNH endonuclease [Geodermatophilaceae bacterium]
MEGNAATEADQTCVFCGTKTTTEAGPDQGQTDHAVPKSQGGNNTPDNAQHTCRTCNLQKGPRTTREFLEP